MPVPLTVPGVIDEFIQAKHVWPRSVEAIRHFGLHTPEGPEMPRYARNLGNYFATTDRVASTHFGCDNELTVRYARDDQTCASAKGINTSGIHIEIAGVAAQTPEQWTDQFSLAALQRAANVFKLYGPGSDTNIPARLLTSAELARGVAGIVKHSTAWQVFGGDFRSDPGAHFPDEMFLAMCRGEEDIDMPTPEVLEKVRRGFNQRDPKDVTIVQDYLRAAGFKPGKSDGVIGDMTVRALKNFGIQGDVTKLGVQGFARLVFAAVGGKSTEQPIVEVPVPGDCADVEAELAKARGMIAAQAQMIATARDALG